jgi:spore coat protein U-like protein
VTSRSSWLGAAVGLFVIIVTPGPVMAACTISASGVSFGGYNVFSNTPLDASGTVTFQCSPLAVNVQVQLSRGGAPSFSPRQMRQGSTTLDYNLFLDVTRTIIWGDGTAGTLVYSALVAPFVDIVVPVYGRVPARQNVPAGSYTDTITATIVF